MAFAERCITTDVIVHRSAYPGNSSEPRSGFYAPSKDDRFDVATTRRPPKKY